MGEIETDFETSGDHLEIPPKSANIVHTTLWGALILIRALAILKSRPTLILSIQYFSHIIMV